MVSLWCVRRCFVFSFCFFFSSRRRHTRLQGDWSSDVCSSDLWDNTVLGWIEIDRARLIAEVNSKARADAIRKKIEKALGAGVRYRASEIQSMEKMLADRGAAGGARGGAAFEESERLAQLPEVREKIS